MIKFNHQAEGCFHKIFGIDCPRHQELMTETAEKCGEVIKIGLKKKSQIFEVALSCAKNEIETIYLAYVFGEILNTTKIEIMGGGELSFGFNKDQKHQFD